MRLFLCLLVVVALVAALGVSAGAQAYGDRYWANWQSVGGTYTVANKTFTQLGFAFSSNAADRAANKSRDYSQVINDAGLTVWGINDNNGPNAYMKGYKDGSSSNGGNVSSIGLVMAKVKYISGSSAGTFGYSNVPTNTGGWLCIRNGQINGKNGNQSAGWGVNGGAAVNTPYATTDWHVYALRWRNDGTFDVWQSVGSDWSGNQADWALVVSNGSGFNAALTDNTSGADFKVGGILVGSPGSSSEAWNGNMQYIVQEHSSQTLSPWEYNPVPEPGSIVALGSGLFAMAGFAIRRRRA